MKDFVSAVYTYFPLRYIGIFKHNFIDGLFYIKYDKDEFKSFKLENFVRNRRVDYNDIKQLYYFIPIDKLKFIQKI